MNSVKKASQDYSFNLSDYLVLLLRCIGYYSFNRYMVKEGYNLKYTLWIHKLESTGKKSLTFSGGKNKIVSQFRKTV